jgi:hypothetical protein
MESSSSVIHIRDADYNVLKTVSLERKGLGSEWAFDVFKFYSQFLIGCR